MQLKHVQENHKRSLKGEELTVDMLQAELNECKISLKKVIKDKEKDILEKHIKNLNFLIKNKINKNRG